MHLRERGGTYRLGVYAGEHFFRGASQFLLKHLPDKRPLYRQHAVLKFAQFFDEGFRKQIGARAENLPQFDEGGSQLFQRFAQVVRGRFERFLRRAQLAFGESESPVDAQVLQRAAESVPRQRGNDLSVALETAHAPC